MGTLAGYDQAYGSGFVGRIYNTIRNQIRLRSELKGVVVFSGW